MPWTRATICPVALNSTYKFTLYIYAPKEQLITLCAVQQISTSCANY